MAQILAVLSGKGGTGKTSLCAAIASCLAMDGASVLCIDLDMGLRNLDIALGMAEMDILPFTSVMRGEYTLDKAAAHPLISGLSLLTAPLTEDPDTLDAEQFENMLSSARASFDWILLDAPAGIGPMFRLAADCADEAAVVCLPDPASRRDASRAAGLVRARRRIPVRLIANRVDKRMFAKMSATVDDLMDETGLPLLGIVPEDPFVPLSAAANVPLVRYTFKGASEACLHIAKRLQGMRVPVIRL